MSGLATFVELGFRHITDLAALDHILFLLALAVIYRRRDWRDAVLVVTAFTIGHSLTLALAVTGTLRFSVPIIEFLIPVTIIATCVENFIYVSRPETSWRRRYRPVFAGVFGLVHGAGFAAYLQEVFPGEILAPLLGFNVGVELGQILVLAALAILFALADALVRAVRRSSPVGAALRYRVIAVSTVVSLLAASWAVERGPW